MDPTAEIRRVTDLLAERHRDRSPELVERLVEDAFAAYADAKVQGFVPVLAQRQVEQLLKSDEHRKDAMARGAGAVV